VIAPAEQRTAVLITCTNSGSAPVGSRPAIVLSQSRIVMVPMMPPVRRQRDPLDGRMLGLAQEDQLAGREGR
jgi:hypothetical protein